MRNGERVAASWPQAAVKPRWGALCFVGLALVVIVLAIVQAGLGSRLVPSPAYRPWVDLAWKAGPRLMPVLWVALVWLDRRTGGFLPTASGQWVRAIVHLPLLAAVTAAMLAAAPLGAVALSTWAAGEEHEGVRAELVSIEEYAPRAKGCKRMSRLSVLSEDIRFCFEGALAEAPWQAGATFVASGRRSRFGFLVQHIQPAPGPRP